MVVQSMPVYKMTDSDRKRQKDIEHAWRAYNGELDRPLVKMPGQPDDNVMTNRCMQIVDRGTDFLFGKELDISVANDAQSTAQASLNSAWGQKEARVPLLQKLAMSGAIAGQAFLRIVPGKNNTFRLIVVDPSTVFVKTSPQDCETPLLFCIEYTTTDTQNGRPVQVYYREEITRVDPDGQGYYGLADDDSWWMVQHWSKVGDRGEWGASGDPIMWLYSFPPIFSCQNLPRPHEFWGIPDITPDIIGVNDSLNLVQSNINRVNKLYGHPIIYATGTGEQVVDVKPGRIIGLPSIESKMGSVPISSDMANALSFAANLRSDIDEQSGVPGVATGRISDTPRGNISGVAIELLYMPLTMKTEKKKCSYGKLIIDVSKALLVLNAISEDTDITLSWQSPLPHDDLSSVQAVLAKKQMGISNTTLQRELGYDPDEEAVLSASQSEQGMQSAPVFPKPQVSPFIGR
jgi:hypothetical protein